MKFIQTIVISLMISGIFTQNTVRQIDVKTSDCDDCGMTFLGQLSVKVGLDFFKNKNVNLSTSYTYLAKLTKFCFN